MTKEQRAEECTYANHSFCKEAYIEGAKEQQKIDIEKACEWLKANSYAFRSDEFLEQLVDAMKGE